MAELKRSEGEAGVWESTERLHLPSHPSSLHVPAAGARLLGSERRYALLARALELEILPRLVLARQDIVGKSETLETVSDEVLELARLVLSGDDEAPLAFVETLRTRGMPIETIFLDLLAPAARHLGDLWTMDVSDFTSVTLGAWQLQQILRALEGSFHTEAPRRGYCLTILLVPVFAEQHTFGLNMVSAFFRRAGWNVTSVPLETREDLIDLVRSEWFSVVGLSLASETRLDDMAGCIRSIRNVSRNRDVGVMVGGPIFIEHPEFVAQVGADMTAADARGAPTQAQHLVSLSQQQ